MTHVRLFCGYALALFFIPFFTYAITDTVIVRTQVGVDTTPPDTPTLLSVVPISYSQINLSWSTSTDDTNLSGYQVFRDGFQIATTSNTFYEDSGLSASTTYLYQITAFDWLMNISSTSNSLGTTTPAFTPTTTPDSSDSTTGSGRRALEILSLKVIPEETGVRIQYETAWYTKTTLEWGSGVSYELGSLQELTFKRFHETFITGLVPGNFYSFRITGEAFNGRTAVLTETQFQTLPGEDVTPPFNPMFFRAAVEDTAVLLTWKNPEDTDFVKTRIVRSDTFYPRDEADGWVVYEGDGERAYDADLEEGAVRYYTAFAYDAKGNVSSGAVQFVRRGGSNTSSTTPIVTDPLENSIQLKFDDLRFEQEGQLLESEGGVVTLDGTKPFTLYIQYERLPEHLKTILVTLTEADTGNEFQFLLRVTPDKRAYAARVGPLGKSGQFPIRITVFDYKTAQVGYTEGSIESRVRMLPSIVGSNEVEQGVLGLLSRVVSSYSFWFLVIIILLIYGAQRVLLRTT